MRFRTAPEDDGGLLGGDEGEGDGLEDDGEGRGDDARVEQRGRMGRVPQHRQVPHLLEALRADGGPRRGDEQDAQHLRRGQGHGQALELLHVVLDAHEGDAEPQRLPQGPEVADDGARGACGG